MSLRHRFHSSRLSALLQQWSAAQEGSVTVDVAQQLGQWLGTVDAVRLSRALHSIETPLNPHRGGSPLRSDEVEALRQHVDAMRAELEALIAAKPAPPRAPRARADSTLQPPADPQAEALFAAHAPRYLALQKQLEARVGALRLDVRAQLARGELALRQLVALDAVMEQTFGPREQRLCALLPGHLERRFVHWHAWHQARLAAASQDDDPSRWREPGGWLAAFERDMQALLQAEMMLRLEPVMGLLEAAGDGNEK